MNPKKQLVCLCIAALLMLLPAALAEDEAVYTMVDPAGHVITQRAGQMHPGDEYISGNNDLYRIVSVDDTSHTAIAENLGEAAIDPPTLSAFFDLRARAEKSAGKNQSDEKRLICMYSTHSDESYLPEDGEASKWENAGIYDVGNALKDELEQRGIRVIYSEESFLPHDADAYNRSRATAEELLKQGPDALLDIHRDAIPAEQYETTVDGEDISMVRLFVGRSNQNSAANKAFAQQIKKVADEKYPGLIKDIYIGKGNYNQELYPQALLLEFGTHKIEKDKAIGATGYIADVLDSVLYGSSAKAETTMDTKTKPAAKGILWVIGLAILGAAVYALFSTGSFGGMWNKLKRQSSEITGGIIGKKPDGKDK